MEDTDVGEQFTVIPVQEGEQELSLEVDAANGDVSVDVSEQPVHGFESFATVAAPYVEQSEVIFILIVVKLDIDTDSWTVCMSAVFFLVRLK